MKPQTQPREFFLDSIRAYLMLLGIPFHISLIYSSHIWAVNSVTPSDGLTIFNDTIHAFRMQVFFVISGYFSYMLYERYERQKWLKVRLERVAIPLAAAFPLITIPQLFFLANFTDKFSNWSSMDFYQKLNITVWELVSHLWFLLTLVILTSISFYLFRALKENKKSRILNIIRDADSLGKISILFLFFGLIYAAFNRTLYLFAPQLLGNGAFNFIVMQTLFYLPFFFIGACTYKFANLKSMFLKPSVPGCIICILLFAAYMINQHVNTPELYSMELDAIITSLLGILMVNVVFSFSHYVLNFQSPFVTYLVNASLFVYLIHHPLTLIYGAFITPLIKSDWVGFWLGLVFVFGIAFFLYEVHKRIPLLRFLFSGKWQFMKKEENEAPAANSRQQQN
ncbi:glucans biosynthesis protein MdoC [Rouxiella badensis]|jgi:glucan biosynthesis protein C|uniref:Glucans biosynthesis protein C n=1 Tax=Rouxiella badensis TaxID=1646377 RepID=A0A1X0WG78_9GAMM|nr:glucans biosynthesis protein MdoC [Rouxiella badensis]MCC3701230.1 glucans biosynthesis protein MdoC [Rouxiella badensis]MCC3717657.1 glucans biosynthesis protein MdoC [Rouxiella badensis]MCC3727399.1 glucans biosynthesis protein MdoC [Rouxiella badensis]MCC3732654.1 glucans biosynthesis protein MdoC [Rouxiella badensis]MCC3739000.1 glucans biosynthesis protein MdoC [Rouxiella badensis]